MSESDYTPWRQDRTTDALADEASKQWRQLIRDSKLYVTQLRQAAGEAEHRISLASRLLQALDQQQEAVTPHRQILQRLDRFERRLDAMERRLAALANAPAAPATRTLHPPRQQAA